MTKNMGVKISIIIAAVLFIGASKPSLDGRALVAAPGELPPGLYVKTAAFLPGDTVLITNPAVKVGIEALVFGTFSPSEGVAVVLSPEAAELLFITKGSNSIVQLTKNGKDTERSVLAKAFDTLPQPAAPEKDTDDSVLYDEYIKTQNVSPDVFAVQPESAPQETAAATENAGESAFYSESPAEPVVQTAAIPEDNAAPADQDDESVFTPFADDKAVTEEKAVQIVQTSETIPEDRQASESVYDEPPVETAESPMEDTLAENTLEAGTDEKTEAAEDASLLTEESPAEEPVIEEPLIEIPPPEESVAEEPVIEEPIAEEITTEEAVIEELPADTEAAVYAEAEGSEAENGFEPNILIAAEENPPIVEKNDESAGFDMIDGEKDTLPDYFTFVQDAPFEETPLYDGAVYADTEQYLIDSLSAFGTGSYCIQLATYKNKLHIADVIEKYADKYPLRLLKSEHIPDAYQVLIGPLNKDEYPVILKRFISRGFKDAFLRRVR